MSDPYQALPADQSPTGTSGKAIASLICGLLSFICAVFTGLPAIILGIMGLNDVKRSEGRTGGRGLAITGILLGTIGTLMTCVVPLLIIPTAISTGWSAAKQAVSLARLKEIGEAFALYETQKQHFPAAAGGEPGQPPHSWRVEILPYIEQAALYDDYHFDEPWDSEHNKSLLDRMPIVFESVGETDVPPNTTNFVAIVGDETMWPKDHGVERSDVGDGVAKTLLIVEVAGLNIPWTEPRDITLEEFIKGINQPGGPKAFYPAGLMVLYADGSISNLSVDTAAEKLKALATRNGGEPTDTP